MNKIPPVMYLQCVSLSRSLHGARLSTRHQHRHRFECWRWRGEKYQFNTKNTQQIVKVEIQKRIKRGSLKRQRMSCRPFAKRWPTPTPLRYAPTRSLPLSGAAQMRYETPSAQRRKENLNYPTRVL